MTSSTFKQLISELHAAYGGFECAATESGGAVITGPYALDAAYKGIRLAEDFELQLTIPKDYPPGPSESQRAHEHHRPGL